MAEYLIILLVAAGVGYGIYELIWLIRRNKLRKKAEEMSESEIWQEYGKVSSQIHNSSPAIYTPPSRMLRLKHNVLVRELDRRDLLELSTVKERQYVECLSEMSDILVYNTFMRAWSMLDKCTKHPRNAAVDYAYTRDELIKRYQKKYAKMSDNDLKKAYAVLSAKMHEAYISRGEYEDYLVAKAEMERRRFASS